MWWFGKTFFGFLWKMFVLSVAFLFHQLLFLILYYVAMHYVCITFMLLSISCPYTMYQTDAFNALWCWSDVLEGYILNQMLFWVWNWQDFTACLLYILKIVFLCLVLLFRVCSSVIFLIVNCSSAYGQVWPIDVNLKFLEPVGRELKSIGKVKLHVFRVVFFFPLNLLLFDFWKKKKKKRKFHSLKSLMLMKFFGVNV